MVWKFELFICRNYWEAKMNLLTIRIRKDMQQNFITLKNYANEITFMDRNKIILN